MKKLRNLILGISTALIISGCSSMPKHFPEVGQSFPKPTGEWAGTRVTSYAHTYPMILKETHKNPLQYDFFIQCNSKDEWPGKQFASYNSQTKTFAISRNLDEKIDHVSNSIPKKYVEEEIVLQVYHPKCPNQ